MFFGTFSACCSDFASKHNWSGMSGLGRTADEKFIFFVLYHVFWNVFRLLYRLRIEKQLTQNVSFRPDSGCKITKILIFVQLRFWICPTKLAFWRGGKHIEKTGSPFVSGPKSGNISGEPGGLPFFCRYLGYMYTSVGRCALHFRGWNSQGTGSFLRTGWG